MTPHPSSRAGFTLIEAMVVLVIIGIMAAAIAPSLSEVLADNRQVTATQDLVRLGRRARSLAMGTGVAHLLRFHDDGSRGLGIFEVWAGMDNHCTQVDWTNQVLVAGNPGDPTSPTIPAEVLDMRDYNPGDGLSAPSSSDTNRQVITARAIVGTNNNTSSPIWFCFQPNGEVYAMSGGGLAAPPPFAKQGLPVVFTISRFVNTSGGTSTLTRGRDRQVVFPVGGSARAR